MISWYDCVFDIMQACLLLNIAGRFGWFLEAAFDSPNNVWYRASVFVVTLACLLLNIVGRFGWFLEAVFGSPNKHVNGSRMSTSSLWWGAPTEAGRFPLLGSLYADLCFAFYNVNFPIPRIRYYCANIYFKRLIVGLTIEFFVHF